METLANKDNVQLGKGLEDGRSSSRLALSRTFSNIDGRTMGVEESVRGEELCHSHRGGGGQDIVGGYRGENGLNAGRRGNSIGHGRCA